MNKLALKAPTLLLRRATMLVACATSASAYAGGGDAILRVGPGAGCDFPTLQQAIDAASPNPDTLTTIRLSTNVNNQTLSILSRNITIDGRYLTCDVNTPLDTLRQTIDGTESDTVISIDNELAGTRNVTLRNVIIRDGGGNGVFSVGGGLDIRGSVSVDLLNSYVSDNEATVGGGIYLTGSGASLTIDGGTIIGEQGGVVGNRALSDNALIAQGGGIACFASARLIINDGRIRANSSTNDGGGVYLNNCDVTIEPRPEFVGEGDGFVTLFQNTAERNGGGLFATNGTDVFWRSLPAGAFGGLASENIAQERGGAVFITGLSNFVGNWLRFDDNEADDRGGTFAVEDTSNLILRGGPGFSCSGLDCPGIYGTRGITEGETATLVGGAIYAESGSTVDLRQQRLYENRARIGSAMFLTGSTTEADLRSVLIARNVLYRLGNSASTVDLSQSAKIQMRYVTMAGNFRVANAFPLVERALASIRANGNSSTVEIRNS
ncbi:MAG: hypothetical protein ABI650_12045, partial [Dokdonella sp.]